MRYAWWLTCAYGAWLGFQAGPDAARLSAAVIDLLGCIALVVLCGEMRVRAAWAAVTLYVLLNVHGLVWVIAATVLAMRLCRKPVLRLWIGYTLAMTVAVWMDPRAMFAGAGHALWWMCWYRPRRHYSWNNVGIGTLVAALALPPAILTMHAWQDSRGVGIAAALILLPAVWALRSGAIHLSRKILLVCWAGMNGLAALAWVVVFGPGYALGQAAMALPPLMLLAGECLAGVIHRSSHRAARELTLEPLRME